MAHPPLNDKFEGVTVGEGSRLLHTLLGEVRQQKRSSMRALLFILMVNPREVTLGMCTDGADVIRLLPSLTWCSEEGSHEVIREVTWGQLQSALNGVRRLLRIKELPYGLWCSCPDFLGGSRKGNYRMGPIPVKVGLVDRRREKKG